MNSVVLSLGTNIGKKSTNLENAIRLVRRELGEIVLQSSVYETEPWGNANQDNFLNQVVTIRSPFEAETIMSKIILIEESLGRKRMQRWEPRIIDIDILFFNNGIISNEKLKVPHPYLHQRKFILVPLNEIMPGFIHPVFNKNMEELLMNLDDCLEVNKINYQLS